MATVAASPQAPSSVKAENLGEKYHMPVDVEEWINKEFGAEMEAGSHETSELISCITAQLVDEYIDMAQVDEYIDMAEFAPTSMRLQEEQAAPFTFFASLDEGLFYEPDLWSFS